MAITKSDIPSLLLPGLKTEFDLAYRQRVDSGIAQLIATTVTTTNPSQKYAWLGATPGMQEFVDERKPQGMQEFNAPGEKTDDTWQIFCGISTFF